MENSHVQLLLHLFTHVLTHTQTRDICRSPDCKLTCDARRWQAAGANRDTWDKEAQTEGLGGDFLQDAYDDAEW